MELSRVTFFLRALGKTQQVVRVLPISLGLQVFVATVRRDNDPNALPVHADEETPLSALNPTDGVGLRDLPLLPVVVPPHILDPLVRVVPVSFVDALNLI